MEPINIKLPHYKQALILRQNFKEFGIKFVYNTSNKCVYISLLAAPPIHTTEEGICMTLTRIYKRFTYVRDNFEQVIEEYKAKYKAYYADNPKMLIYLESINKSE